MQNEEEQKRFDKNFAEPQIWCDATLISALLYQDVKDAAHAMSIHEDIQAEVDPDDLRKAFVAYVTCTEKDPYGEFEIGDQYWRVVPEGTPFSYPVWMEGF